ncbi:uncharacterized protein UDID_05524 [Ustilago sp. UG-2017a]|uniref:Uncharacterized protein n=1 Tax=Ustilago hordei TaxID=120017 RepID=I2FX61_USTHO|nr:uncharacterized protein UHOR_05524 [Ustilago hordei]SOV02417.1 uncharacterized protein UDID_05524 [Ustilago sp. UG-2017a]SPC68020.1 uncharacterized protein UHOD_05524 [Ustilago sp. UG-2017b]
MSTLTQRRSEDTHPGVDERISHTLYTEL